jgi:hypothetical protein
MSVFTRPEDGHVPAPDRPTNPRPSPGFSRRLLAGLVFLLALTILLVVVAAGVGVWIVKEPVTARAHWLYERVDKALDMADQSLDHAGTSLANASERLGGVKQAQRKLAQEPRRDSPFGRFLMRTVQQKVAIDLENAQDTLHNVAEAAVVVNSVLEDMGSFPLLSESGLELSGLHAMNQRLADVGPAAWELSRLLGNQTSDTDPETADELSNIERTVETMQRFIGDYHAQVKQARERVDGLKSRTFKWITPAAVLISFFCFWFAVSQISLLAHARSWWRGPTVPTR